MIRGHEKEREIFGRIIAEGRLHHAYLLNGREGVGKKLFALEIARSLICENGSFMQGCECRHCRLIKNTNIRIESEIPQVKEKKSSKAVQVQEAFDKSPHPDIHLIEQTPLKIDTAREINEGAFMSPMSASKKIYIIDNADSFGLEAANALLKTLEEPPADTYFFLITSRYQQVLHTIRSRCIGIGFGQLADEDVWAIVDEKSDKPFKEKQTAVKICAGSAGQALRLLSSAESGAVFTGIENRVSLYEEINALETKDAIKTYCASLYTHLLERYRATGRESLLDFSNYLLDILKRLEYNVSLDIFRIDLYVKTIEVLSEKS